MRYLGLDLFFVLSCFSIEALRLFKLLWLGGYAGALVAFLGFSFINTETDAYW
jgi:hypothetical protein